MEHSWTFDKVLNTPNLLRAWKVVVRNLNYSNQMLAKTVLGFLSHKRNLPKAVDPSAFRFQTYGGVQCRNPNGKGLSEYWTSSDFSVPLLTIRTGIANVLDQNSIVQKMYQTFGMLLIVVYISHIFSKTCFFPVLHSLIIIPLWWGPYCITVSSYLGLLQLSQLLHPPLFKFDSWYCCRLQYWL